MKRLVVAVLLLLVIGWLAWKWQPTAEQRVLSSIQRLSQAKTPPVKQQIGALCSDVKKGGLSTVNLLVQRLKHGTRAHRLAVQRLLLCLGKRGPKWRSRVLSQLSTLDDSKDWRQREVVANVRLGLRLSKEMRARTLSTLLSDTSPELRYLAVNWLRGDKELHALTWHGVKALMKTGVKRPPKSLHVRLAVKPKGDPHAGHNHPPISLQSHFRDRSLCQIDRDDHWGARLSFVKVAAQWGVPDFELTQTLLAAASDRHKALQKEALRQLRLMGKRAVPTITHVFAKASTPRRRELSRILGTMKTDGFAFLWKQFQEGDAVLWRAALVGLLVMTPPSPKELAQVCQALSTSKGRRGHGVARLLGAWGRTSIASRRCLLRGLASSRAIVVSRALYGCGEVSRHLCGVSSKKRAPLCRKWVGLSGTLLLSFVKGTGTGCAEAAWAIGHTGRAGKGLAKELLAHLAQPASRKNVACHGVAIAALSRIGTELRDVRRWLTGFLESERLSKEADVRVISSVLRVWSRATRGLFSEEQGKRLFVLATMPSNRVHRALGWFWRRHGVGFANGTNELMGRLSSHHAGERWVAAFALSAWKKSSKAIRTRVAKGLVARLLVESQLRVQQRMARSLVAVLGVASRGGPGVGGLSQADWRKWLAQTDWRVRDMALLALGQGGEASSFVRKELETLLRSPKRLLRRRAAWAIGQLGKAGIPSIDALRKAMKDHAIDVQHAAKRALSLVRYAEDQQNKQPTKTK